MFWVQEEQGSGTFHSNLKWNNLELQQLKQNSTKKALQAEWRSKSSVKYHISECSEPCKYMCMYSWSQYDIWK